MFSLVTFRQPDAEDDRLGVMEGDTLVELSEDLGSPGGIGAQTGTLPAVGDRLRIEIDGIGALEQTMVDA